MHSRVTLLILVKLDDEEVARRVLVGPAPNSLGFSSYAFGLASVSSSRRTSYTRLLFSLIIKIIKEIPSIATPRKAKTTLLKSTSLTTSTPVTV